MLNLKKETYYLSPKPDEKIHIKSCQHYRDNFKLIKYNNMIKNNLAPFCEECCGITRLEELALKKMILTGNGGHSAVFEGFINIRNPEGGENTYTATFYDNTELPLTFTNRTVKRLVKKHYVGKVIYAVAYPKSFRGELVSLELVGWERKIKFNTETVRQEIWNLTGYWSYKKRLMIQRDVYRDSIAKTRFQRNGKIPQVNFSFINTDDFIARKKLWVNHVYACQCERIGKELKLLSAQPFCSQWPQQANKKTKYTPNNLILR